MKKTTTFFLLFLFSVSTFAQRTVQGKVLDKKDDAAVEAATIRLLNAKDSSLVQGCFTDVKGGFLLNRVKNGNYILEVRFLGYTNAFQSFTVQDKNVLLKNMYLSSSQKNLKEVEVTGMTAQMQVRGDTVEYNPAAFKLADNAVVEDLLKKLPGVEVDAEGKVKVNGQEITKVRVDGKKFFEGDVTMATKNFTVDMVDKVQVIDQKSEMAQLTGFEDENTERIINLTIKANRKKGTFGNVSAGAGADKDDIFRYDGNGMVNIMRGESMNTITASANNTNNSRSGRGRQGMMAGGGGFTEAQSFGLNNNTELSKTLKVGGNASYNHRTSTSISSSERENYMKDTTYLNNSNSESLRENNEANMRLEMEWNIDTLTTMIVQPNITYTTGYSESTSDGTNMQRPIDLLTGGDTISNSESTNSSNSSSIGSGMRVIFSRKSAVKRGRTFSLNISGDMEKSSGNGQRFTQLWTKAYGDSIIDQRSTNSSNSYSTDIRVSFVEPLWNLQNFLEFAGSFRGNWRNSEQLQFDKGLDGVYDQLDTRYSNSFENTFYSESAEINFRHAAQSYSYMFGISANPSQTMSQTYYSINSANDSTLSRTNKVFNFSPTGEFRYNFGRRQFARMQYRGRTSQPSIDQMQPVKTNDLLNETVGNPSLNPSFSHNLNLMYSSFNQERFSSVNIGLNGNYTLDALVRNTVYDKKGKSYNQTVNVDPKYAPFNAGFNLSYNVPIIQKRLQFYTNTSLNYSRSTGYSDRTKRDNPYDENGDLSLGYLSKTMTKGGSQNLSLSLTTDVVEVGLRGNVRYNNSLNNLLNRHQETVDYTASGNINLILPYSLTITNNLDYTTREGYSSYTKDEWVWNATIDKSVLNKKGTLSLRFYDILRQKQNIRENIGDNSRSLTRSNQLTSYFLLSFTYRIANFGGGANAGDMFRGGGGMRRGGGFGGGGMGGGGFGGGGFGY